MAAQGRAADASTRQEAAGGLAYARHRPEETRLYRLVEQHYPAFVASLAEQGKVLPAYVEEREFEAYLKCGRLEHGFLRVRCESCHFERLVAFSCKKRGFCPSCGARRMAETAALLADEVLPALPLRQWVVSFPFALRFLFASRPEALAKALEVIYRLLVTHLAHKAGFRCKEVATGAVTLVQRFGSALNLNIHLHMLCLDGVYVPRSVGGLRFRRVKAPEREELEHLVQQIAERVGRALERMGLLQRDAESAWLELPSVEDTDAIRQLLGSSVTYRIAVGPQAGRKALVLRTITALAGEEPRNERVAKANGFSLHAGVSCEAHQRTVRERLCRYIARPAVAEQRLTVNAQGKVVYLLKTPYRDGTTHVVFEPLDFIARLAALVPRPRVNLTRYHGVLAPNHRWRAEVTPSGRGAGGREGTAQPERSAIERHAAMSWAQRLKRVFGIDVESCVRCGQAVKIIACIESRR
ncbi:MAG: transposase [Gammaproteobacteria bacterium]|nr:transposase [Gammaproteobacteria bacterium]